MFPDYQKGGYSILFQRLKEGTLKVDFSTGKIYSLNGKWKELTWQYDEHAGKQRYAFVFIRKKCVSYFKDRKGISHRRVVWRRKGIAVHKVVWYAKHGPGSIPRDYELHHKDLNSLHNWLSNLRLMLKVKHHDLHAELDSVPF